MSYAPKREPDYSLMFFILIGLLASAMPTKGGENDRSEVRHASTRGL